MKVFLRTIFAVLPFITVAQQQYAENENPNNIASGVYYQRGPGSNNTLNWTFPYGTKLTVKADATTTRNFEIATSGYPYGRLSLRQWDPWQNVWTPWRQILMENQDGIFKLENEFQITESDSRGSSYLKILRGSEGKDKAVISYGQGSSFGWYSGLLYGGGWLTPDFHISQKDHFRDGNGNYVHEPEFTIKTNGDVGIGTRTPDSKLAVNGNIHAKEVKVDLIGWPDYVFQKGYDLPTLEEVEKYITEKGHLINIPSATEVEKNGVQLGEMNKLLLQKIEELTLYIIELKKENELQNNMIVKLLKRNNQ